MRYKFVTIILYTIIYLMIKVFRSISGMNCLKNISKLMIVSLLLILIASPFYSFAAQKKLVFSATLIRHGDRTPWQPMLNEKYHYDWKLGVGALTPTGMREEYNLGKHLRKLYVNKENLLPKEYQSGSILVWAGQQSRLVLSAQSFLAGLYPLGTGLKLPSGVPALPGAPTLIPIYTLNDQTMFDAADNTKSELYQELLKKDIYSTELWKARNKALRENYPLEKWSEISGYPINNYYDLQGFFDNLNVRYIHHIPFPKGISVEIFKKLYPKVVWSEAYTFSALSTGYLEGGTLIGSVMKYMQEYMRNPAQKLKFVLYAGHDVTINGVLSALGVPLNKNPHYASYVNFELYKVAKGYQVKIIYNDKTILLPACQNQVCTYQQFQVLAKSIIYKQKKLFSSVLKK